MRWGGTEEGDERSADHAAIQPLAPGVRGSMAETHSLWEKMKIRCPGDEQKK
jgi:hypothetical protein